MARRKPKSWFAAQIKHWRKLPPRRRWAAAFLAASFVVVSGLLVGYLASALTGPVAAPQKTALAPSTTQAPPARAPQSAAKPEDAPAWKRHAAAYVAPPRDRAWVAIVIDDMGLDRSRSQRVLELLGPLTLSFLPYAKDLAGQMRFGKDRGHELMLHLPMEPTGNADPGPDALRTDLSGEEIRRRINEALARTPQIVGINNHMGSKFTAWRPGMEVVIAELKRRGLLFLDSRTTAQTLGAQIAGEQGVPTLSRHVFLDDVLLADNVWHQLGELERIAKTRGYAIAIGHPHDNTLAALAQFLPQMQGKGLALVPLTALLERPQR